MKLRQLIIFLICLSPFSGDLFAKEQKENLIIGTSSGYAPYVSLNSKGEYEGFDIDVAKLLAKKLDKNLVLQDLGSMPSLILALNMGKVDALIWAISITETRQQQMDMIYYQGEKVTSMPLLFWKKIPDGVKDPEDLKKKAICVEAGTYQEQVMKGFSDINLKNVDKITDAILELKFGKSLAIAIDSGLIPMAKTQNPELQVLYFALPPSMQSLGNGICVNKKKPELSAQIRKAVSEMQQEGTIAELEKKWNLKEEN